MSFSVSVKGGVKRYHCLLYARAKEGWNTRLTSLKLQKAKDTVVSQHIESDNMKKTGRMVEKSKFEEQNQDRPAMLKKAQYFPRRVREGDKYTVKMFTKVYNEEEGEYLFEEIQGKTIIRNQTIDDGSYSVAEDQQERNFEQSAGHMFGATFSSRSSLLASEVDPPQVRVKSEAASSSSRAGTATKRDREKYDVVSRDEDGLPPLEKSLAVGQPKKQAKQKQRKT